jgi:uncharacterized membrane protein
MAVIVVAYLSTAVIFLGLDAIWLRNAADLLYRPMLGAILLERFRLMPALLFYLLYVSGVVKFAVLPALESGRWTTALVSGAWLGLIAYGTYDLSNQATLKVWPTLVTTVDLCWGTCLTASASVLAYMATKLILNAHS